MSSQSQPSITTRILDALFGERLTGVEAGRARAAQPLRWVEWIFVVLFAAWLCLFAFWGFRALGWLPVVMSDFEWPSLLWVSGLGLAMTLSREEISKHYQRRAKQTAEPAKTSRAQ